MIFEADNEYPKYVVCLPLPLQHTQMQIKRQNDFYGMEPAYRISGSEEDIQWEILNNGPVQGERERENDVLK